MVLDDCVQKGTEEVCEVEKQENNGACVHTHPVHKILDPGLPLKILVGAVVIHPLDRLGGNHEIDQGVDNEPRSVKLTGIVDHLLQVSIPGHLAKRRDCVEPLLVSRKASLVRDGSKTEPVCYDKWNRMD